jgi:transposase
MYIACTKNHGIPYLQIHEAYTTKKDGKTYRGAKLIRSIGPLSRYDDGKPDFLNRLRQSFKEGKPIITGLEDLVNMRPAISRIVFELDKNDIANSFCSPKNIGYFLLDGLYDSLGIYDVLNLHKSRSKIAYDLNGLAKLLVFGRTLSPASKLETWNTRYNYAFDIVSSDQLIEVYRVLDVLDNKSETIQKRMNLKIGKAVGRNTEVCFYDVTNYWFEIDENDQDVRDEAGNIVEKGLRKKGVSKEKRGEPIVQMGLFIDDNGIPIAYRLFPGNATDQTTLIPALEKSIDNMNFQKVIVVADGGLNTGPNIAHMLSRGNGYILSKSTKKSDKTVKEWILDQSGYEWNDNRTFKVKSMIRSRKIKNEAGQALEVKEKLVCYWSKKHYDKEYHENAKFIEYLNSVVAFPDKLKDKQKKIEQFLIKRQVDKSSGEVLDTATHLSVDMDKIQEYLDLLGYYTIMTSEIDKSDREIINKYHGLSRIEDSFRIIKGDLDGRPVYVQTKEHINGHFLVCFISLAMIRLIQHKILGHLGKDTLNEAGWESGLTAERIKKALSGFQADALPGGYFRLTKPTDDLRLILDSLGIYTDLRLPTVHELRQLKYSFDKAFVM